MSTQLKTRFSKPTVLTDSTLVLGVAFGQWNQVFTGNMADTLKSVERSVKAANARHPGAAAALISDKSRISNDLASSVKRLKAAGHK